MSHLFYYSCSDNGTVVVSTVGLGIEDKDTVIHFNQSMKALCVENDSAAKKDKSFIVGKTEVRIAWANSTDVTDAKRTLATLLSYSSLYCSRVIVSLMTLLPLFR